MDGRTSGSSRGNPRAVWSVVCGILSVAAIPVGTLLARQLEQVTLLQSAGSILIGALLGWVAIGQSRRARERVQITLGRAGGEGLARVGKMLGIVGLLLAATAALALGFWGLLSQFAE